jgi:phage-related protein
LSEISFEIDYFKLGSGHCPFKEFLESLILEDRVDILSSIEELRFRLNNSLNVSNKLSKHLRDGIFEVRVKHRTKISRSLYFFQFGKKIVFTNGFIKKTEETPKKEIEKAINYKNIFINEMKNENKNYP